MASPPDAVITPSDSIMAPICVITSLPKGDRVVEIHLNSSAPVTLRTIASSDPLNAGGGNDMTDKLNEIDGRLRGVEIDVSTIKERLTHMPTKHEMWVAIAVPTLAIASAIGIVTWWVIQQYLGPILAKAGGG